ncbi:hypothetical protein P7K49_011957 [Saguinus oedipus]|uniref:Cytosolic endo-beta-N-acetylglucosaminidase TIM barrel domain-containing protein n=1 Tax=Saguinus oedipus TaxID=9490 RepID=A0ABQ9VSS3_SAGOE|nr:hypothetical protein P7K49_011957 [Saguinus oedipus]
MSGFREFIQGSAAQTPYAFYHWQYIDVFVYFSHHAVTIPPVGWTNAAHRQGVCVLGTFITEWNEGARLCESFLAGDERSYQAVANQLVQIAQFFRFDGWLINIENPLSLAAVGNMSPFLRYLTMQLHRQVPGGLVLWYDSVVQSGQLKWQNELNEHNRRACRRGCEGQCLMLVFFDSCDGFFTNYNWQEEHLERMLGQAGERRADVYVGVDVFARGNVVGGRFDSDKVGGPPRPRPWPRASPGNSFPHGPSIPARISEELQQLFFPEQGPCGTEKQGVLPGQAVSPLKPLPSYFYSWLVCFCVGVTGQRRPVPCRLVFMGLSLQSPLHSLTSPPGKPGRSRRGLLHLSGGSGQR